MATRYFYASHPISDSVNHPHHPLQGVVLPVTPPRASAVVRNGRPVTPISNESIRQRDPSESPCRLATSLQTRIIGISLRRAKHAKSPPQTQDQVSSHSRNQFLFVDPFSPSRLRTRMEIWPTKTRWLFNCRVIGRLLTVVHQPCVFGRSSELVVYF